MKALGSYVSIEEQKRRYDELARVLEDAGCDSAVVVGPPQIGGKRYFRYFTDWNIQSIGGYLVTRNQENPVAIFKASSQAYWARRIDWIQDVAAVDRPIKRVLELLKSGASSRVGVVGRDFFALSDYEILSESFPDALVDVTSQIDRVMSVKSDEEQQLLQGSAQIFDAAWRSVLEGAKPGMTEWEVAALAGSELLAGGVSHSVILIGASAPSSPALCAGWPRDRAVGPDDVIQMSIEGPGPNGYSIEVGGTFSFRRPDKVMLRQFEAQVAGIEAGVAALRTGRTGGDVAGAIVAAFAAAGFKSGYWAGHGIGLGIPEPPTIEAATEDELVKGMAIALHPNAVGEDGRGSLLSRTYMVGDSRGEPLSTFTLEWGELW